MVELYVRKEILIPLFWDVMDQLGMANEKGNMMTSLKDIWSQVWWWAPAISATL
jgi:hypothetical protein